MANVLVVGTHNFPVDLVSRIIPGAFVDLLGNTSGEIKDPPVIYHPARNTRFERILSQLCENFGWEQHLVKPEAIPGVATKVDLIIAFVIQSSSPELKAWVKDLEERGLPAVEITV